MNNNKKTLPMMLVIAGGILGHRIDFVPRPFQVKKNYRPWLKRTKGRS